MSRVYAYCYNNHYYDILQCENGYWFVPFSYFDTDFDSTAQPPYIPLASANWTSANGMSVTAVSESSDDKTLLIISISAGTGGCLLILCVCIICKKRKNQNKHGHQQAGMQTKKQKHNATAITLAALGMYAFN